MRTGRNGRAGAGLPAGGIRTGLTDAGADGPTLAGVTVRR